MASNDNDKTSVGIEIRDLLAELILDRLRFVKENKEHLDCSEIVAITNFLHRQNVSVLQKPTAAVFAFADSIPNWKEIMAKGPSGVLRGGSGAQAGMIGGSGAVPLLEAAKARQNNGGRDE